MTIQRPDARGRFGTYGGVFAPETLMPALDELVAEEPAAEFPGMVTEPVPPTVAPAGTEAWVHPWPTVASGSRARARCATVRRWRWCSPTRDRYTSNVTPWASGSSSPQLMVQVWRRM